MYFKNLFVSSFRNVENLSLNLSERLNIFVGQNGQGKTNLIEAIYLLLEGESFRYSNNETLIRYEQPFAFLKADLVNENLDYHFKLQILPAKKHLIINEKNTSFEKHNLPSVILFSPESLSIIKENSEERRNLADQLLAQKHIRNKILLKEFKRTLRTRNKILKDISQEKMNFSLGIETLRSLNPIYLKQATEITYLRISELTSIKQEVEISLNQINKGQQNNFDFYYMISDKNCAFLNFAEIQENLKKRMEELESAETKTGTTLVGPQKHDVIFLYNGKDSRYFCSQGQQRSIILAFKMAQIVYHHRVHGYYPVLLLDDVLSELDLSKQSSLIETLNQTETQTFVTTTDVALLSKLSITNTRVFSIENGQLITSFC